MLLPNLLNLLRSVDPSGDTDEPLEGRSMVEAMRLRQFVSDREFDKFLPEELRDVSAQFWTPLRVIARAAEWFNELDIRTVVDIGSGAGKFCVAGALYGGRTRYLGLEHRPRLVAGARFLARTLRVEPQVRFVHGVLGTARLPEPDAYYLYNPFGENTFRDTNHLDEDVELSEERYFEDIRRVESLLGHASTGTYVLTYNGFGGYVPGGYREVRVDRSLPNVLRLWQKSGNPWGMPHSSDDR